MALTELNLGRQIQIYNLLGNLYQIEKLKKLRYANFD